MHAVAFNVPVCCAHSSHWIAGTLKRCTWFSTLGNCWFEVGRDVDQCLMTRARHGGRTEYPAEQCTRASCGPRQPKLWTTTGLEELCVKVFGPAMQQPLTKLHGAQVESCSRFRWAPTLQRLKLVCITRCVVHAVPSHSIARCASLH